MYQDGVTLQNNIVYVTIFKKTDWLVRKPVIVHTRKYVFSRLSTYDTNGNKEERSVSLKDRVSDRLQRMAASSVNIKITRHFLANWSVLNMVSLYCIC